MDIEGSITAILNKQENDVHIHVSSSMKDGLVQLSVATDPSSVDEANMLMSRVNEFCWPCVTTN